MHSLQTCSYIGPWAKAKKYIVPAHTLFKGLIIFEDTQPVHFLQTWIYIGPQAKKAIVPAHTLFKGLIISHLNLKRLSAAMYIHQPTGKEGKGRYCPSPYAIQGADYIPFRACSC
jgi:hypothetical protein